MPSSTFTFFSHFLRHPMATGAIAPSSPALASQMLAGLDLKPGQGVVEFGPGTGPFTKAIREAIPSPKDYLGIELNETFVQHLRTHYPDLNFAHDSAANADTLAKEAGMEKVKVILCGLPFASLPPSVQDEVTAALDRLMTKGTEFRTFQYVQAYPLPTATRYRRKMRQLFGQEERSRAVLANLPPAYVLTWKR